MAAKTKAQTKKSSGPSFTQADFIKAYQSGPGELTLDIDPRIDLTKPIYEQVMKLTAKDKALEERAAKRKRHSHAA